MGIKFRGPTATESFQANLPSARLLGCMFYFDVVILLCRSIEPRGSRLHGKYKSHCLRRERWPRVLLPAVKKHGGNLHVLKKNPKHRNRPAASVYAAWSGVSPSATTATGRPRVGLCKTNASCRRARRKSVTARIRINQPIIIKT